MIIHPAQVDGRNNNEDQDVLAAAALLNINDKSDRPLNNDQAPPLPGNNNQEVCPNFNQPYPPPAKLPPRNNKLPPSPPSPPPPHNNNLVRALPPVSPQHAALVRTGAPELLDITEEILAETALVTRQRQHLAQ